MLVFKFGGASVKDAKSVKNVASILQLYQNQNILVIVSAMGKMTNLFEELVTAYKDNNNENIDYILQKAYNYHFDIIKELYPEKHHTVFYKIEQIFENLKNKKEGFFSENYNYEYDQIVSLGEVISTIIIETYLREIGEKSIWVDARKLVRTDNNYRDANVDWNKTENLIQNNVKPLFNKSNIVVTQGFIAHTSEGFTTTLGREGSDYSSAIFAYCLNAKSVTIWKDVPGMLNADPKWFDKTVKLDKISFKEAIELSYYGASVIHPKTIKPLQNKNIPLYVKSFINPSAEGTIIQETQEFDHLIPSFIFKMNQVLFSITPKDFSFVMENDLSKIFNSLSNKGVKINLMQLSALSFSFCVDHEKIKINEILELFNKEYHIKYNENLELVTIRHFNEETINRVMVNKEFILEQKTRQTIRILMKDKS